MSFTRTHFILPIVSFRCCLLLLTSKQYQLLRSVLSIGRWILCDLMTFSFVFFFWVVSILFSLCFSVFNVLIRVNGNVANLLLIVFEFCFNFLFVVIPPSQSIVNRHLIYDLFHPVIVLFFLSYCLLVHNLFCFSLSI